MSVEMTEVNAEERADVDALSERIAEELGADRLIAVYRDMLLMRRFEERAGRAYQQGKIKGFCHLYIGQEAVAAAAMAAIDERDYIVTHYREHGHALARGLDPNAIMAELFGRATGVSGGKGGSMHLFDTEKHFYGGWGIVGGYAPTGAGVAFAAKYRDEHAVCLTFMGDGAIHQGAVHETMNMAELWDLPVVFIVENNGYGMGTALERASSITDIQLKAVAYGMEHASCDGQNFFVAYDTLKRAVDHARNDSRPSFLDVQTYRFRGHSMSDPATYRTKEELNSEMGRDPIQQLHNWLVEHGAKTDDELKAMDKEAKAQAKEAEAYADAQPFPDDGALTRDVYVEWPFDIEGTDL